MRKCKVCLLENLNKTPNGDQTLNVLYSCFEKGCPTKPYVTMPKGIMDNGGS